MDAASKKYFSATRTCVPIQAGKDKDIASATPLSSRHKDNLAFMSHIWTRDAEFGKQPPSAMHNNELYLFHGVNSAGLLHVLQNGFTLGGGGGSAHGVGIYTAGSVLLLLCVRAVEM